MKKRLFLLLSFFVLFLFTNFTFAISDYSLTGRATSQPLNLNITITGAPPAINIIQPINSVYLSNFSVALSYTQSGAFSVWFNIDNQGNISLFSNTYYFNVSEGTHVLNLFANNSDGESTNASITFIANTTYLNISYEEFRGEGNSTDFVRYNIAQLESLSNLTFEKTLYGKIFFYSPVNITDIDYLYPRSIDFDSNVNISFNQIYLNQSYLTNLSQKARLSLKGLSLTNPRILRNGLLCPQPVCVIQSYSSGELIFNVTGFSTYSAEETPSSSGSGGNGGGGGGGGGGASSLENTNFETDKDSLSVNLKQGETMQGNITFTNTDKSNIKIAIYQNKLLGLINFREEYIELAPNESKTLYFDFIALEDTKPGLYLGEIIFSSSKGSKQVLVAINIDSKNALFDIKVEIPEEYSIINPGDELLAKIWLYNFGDLERTDVFLDYYILNRDGETILHQKETLAVQTQLSFIKEFKIPLDIKSDKYLLLANVTYGRESANAAAWFSVINSDLEHPRNSLTKVIVLVAIFIVCLIVLIIIIIRNERSRRLW